MTDTMKPIFPMGCWTYFYSIDDAPEDLIRDWVDLGLTTPIAPAFGSDSDKAKMLAFLDECLTNGVYPYLYDFRASVFAARDKDGEPDYAAFREKFASALADFGSHPAVSGFFVHDEPDGKLLPVCLEVCRIQREMAPHLTPFLNLLPCWHGDAGLLDRIGVPEEDRGGDAPMRGILDLCVKDGRLPMIGYDNYSQECNGDSGFDGYFENLRQYRDLVTRTPGVKFNTTLLCTNHYDYRIRSQDDFRWQISTAAAMGAKALWWFYPDMRHGDADNYRDAPINQLGERTQTFSWMSTEVRMFTKQFGAEFAAFTPEGAYMTVRSYGGIPLFEGDCDRDLTDAESLGQDKAPLLLSFFHNDAGERFAAIVNLSRTDNQNVVLYVEPAVEASFKHWNGRWVGLHYYDPADKPYDHKCKLCRRANTWMAPGQLILIKLSRKSKS